MASDRAVGRRGHAGASGPGARLSVRVAAWRDRRGRCEWCGTDLAAGSGRVPGYRACGPACAGHLQDWHGLAPS